MPIIRIKVWADAALNTQVKSKLLFVNLANHQTNYCSISCFLVDKANPYVLIYILSISSALQEE